MKFKLLAVLALTSTVTFAEQTSEQTAKQNTEQTEPSSKLLQSIVPAKPLKRVPPKYPERENRKGREGWVKLSYVIEPDGSVSNPFVIDSSGLVDFEKSALRAVKKWQFTPATENGKAIQQCVNAIQLNFRMQVNGDGPGVRSAFRSMYKQVVTSFDNKDFERSKALLDKMEDKKRFTLYEDKLLWQLKGYYYQYIGNDKMALANFNRSSYKIGKKPDQFYLPVLDNIFVLQIKQNLLAAALETYAKIAASKDNDAFIKRLKPFHQKIQALVASDQIISVPNTIGSRGFTYYSLVRNHFEISQVKGEVNKIKVFCDNKQNTFSYAADSSWSIPQSWGKCSLYVYGTKQTAFNIVEHPKKV